MAKHQHLDIDTLGSTTKFEQLCNSLLSHYFGSEVVPYGALGPDGGIDALLNGLPGNYLYFKGKPLIYGKKQQLTPGLWVFQAKFHFAHKNGLALKDFKNELSAWKTRRQTTPAYFIFLTNLVLKPSEHKAFHKFQKKPPKPFKYFDYWDGEKIAALVSGHGDIRSTYFPNCEDTNKRLENIEGVLEKVITRKSNSKKKKTISKKSKTLNRGKNSKTSFLRTTDELAKYEAEFSNANSAIVDQFKESTGDIPSTWLKTDIKSKRNGILTLTEASPKIIEQLRSANMVGSFYIRPWHKYLGEDVKKDEVIASVACDPEDKELIELMQDKLFTVSSGQNTKHKVIDATIKTLTTNAISALRESDLFRADDALRKLFHLKSQYIEARHKYGAGFYPNSRRLGRLTFGWSFVSLWDDAFERVCDIALAQAQPDDLYRLISNIPESLAKKAIEHRLPKDDVIAEASTLTLLLYKADERKVQKLWDSAMSGIENIYEHFKDEEHRTKGVSDSKYIFALAEVFVDFALELARQSLSKKLKIELGAAIRFIGLATSHHFSNYVGSSTTSDWVKDYDQLKNLDKNNSDLQNEAWFAIGTYAWFLVRKGEAELGQTALSYLGRVPLVQVVALYEKRDKLRRWYSWWFNPEGKRAAWVTSVDHDIRDSLLVRLCLGPISKEEIQNLHLLETQSGADDLLRDIRVAYSQLNKVEKVKLLPLAEVESTVAAARLLAEEKRLDNLRQQTDLSKSKISTITESFKKSLLEHDPSGMLYSIDVLPETSFKPSHYVGLYTVHDKEWFVENTGSVSYSVQSMGSQWAESILQGRESLLAELLVKDQSVKNIPLVELEELLNELKSKCSSEQVLFISSFSVPWHLKQKYFIGKHQLAPGDRPFASGQIYRVGNADIFIGRRLEKGLIVLMSKKAASWQTTARCLEPRINTIDPDSVEGKQIKSKYPEMDLKLKTLVHARELGSMVINALETTNISRWKVIAKGDEELV